jgi:secretion/DNA translocation related TadE-like protein
MRTLRRKRRSRPLIGSENGSATVLVLAFAMALVLLAMALATGVALAGAGQRARTAADLAALAVADHTGRVVTGKPDACGLGERVAAANGARLVACRADSSRSRVEVAVALPWGGEARRVAEAAPGS